jgi:hypothetical protein
MAMKLGCATFLHERLALTKLLSEAEISLITQALPEG